MKLKNKVLIGLLLAAQINGVQAKGDGTERYNPLDPAWQKKNAEMKAEGRTYQAQLEADYQAYVKNVTAQNKKHTNWTPVEPMPKSDWLRYGRPQHN